MAHIVVYLSLTIICMFAWAQSAISMIFIYSLCSHSAPGHTMAESTETGQGVYTKDGSVDLKGNPVLRSKRGGWTACSFVVGNCLLQLFLLVAVAAFVTCL